MHNNPHHFTLCVKYWGKIPKSQKWELIVLLLFTFSFANMATAISAPTHTVSYNRNKSIEYDCLSNQWGVLRGELVVNLYGEGDTHSTEGK